MIQWKGEANCTNGKILFNNNFPKQGVPNDLAGFCSVENEPM